MKAYIAASLRWLEGKQVKPTYLQQIMKIFFTDYFYLYI